jgi:hypothetical protein
LRVTRTVPLVHVTTVQGTLVIIAGVGRLVHPTTVPVAAMVASGAPSEVALAPAGTMVITPK